MPDDLPTGGASPAPAGGVAPAAAEPIAPVAAAPVVPAAPEPAAAAPAADAAPVAAPAAAPAAPEKDAAPAPAADKPADKAPDKPADKATPEFAPSLLDEAAKPAADAKPSDKPADKPVDKKDDAAKPPADKAPAADPAPPVPIEYAFKYPDGFNPDQVDTERMGAFTGILNDARVAPESAQKLMDLHVGEINRVADAITTRQWDTFNATQNDWRKDTMADPEIGGARHETALKTVMSLVDAYGNRFQGTKQQRDAATIAAERKDLLDVFRMTGAANNRLILGLLHFAGEGRREGVARPAPPPRGGQPNAGNRGLNRYRSS